MNVVHIGFPKTGTTSIQQGLMPLLDRYNLNFNINKRWLKKACAKHHLFGLTDNELQKVKAELKNNNFLSIEDLLHPDPSYWKISFERNRQLFEPDTVILITLRPTVDFLESYYNELYKQGLRTTPEEFFITDDKYHLIKNSNSFHIGKFFNTDLFCYRNLVDLYKDYFSEVCVVPLDFLGELNFVRKYLISDPNIFSEIRTEFAQLPRYNKTKFGFELALNYFFNNLVHNMGFVPRSYYDKDLFKIHNRLTKDIINEDAKNPNFSEEWKKMFLGKKIFLKIQNHLLRVINRIDKFFGNKFSTTLGLRDFPKSGIISQDLADANDRFLEGLER